MSLTTPARDRVASPTAGRGRSAASISRHVTWYAILTLAFVAASPAPDPEHSPREAFNAGAVRLKEGKLREAESVLEGVLATQEEAWRVPALYNLGHIRFAQGMEELQKSQEAGPAAARGRAVAMSARETSGEAQDALRANDLSRLINTYVRGRGVRKDLRAAMKAVRQALQVHAVALNRLERAAGDWKGAVELDPQNQDAKHNLDVAEKHIARIIDSIRDLQQGLQAMQGAGQELQDMMSQMRGRIPQENMPPGAPGEEEEEEEGGMEPPMTGEQPAGREGEERSISPEEAGWLLEGFKAGEDRRLPMTQGGEGQPKDKNRPTW